VERITFAFLFSLSEEKEEEEREREEEEQRETFSSLLSDSIIDQHSVVHHII